MPAPKIDTIEQLHAYLCAAMQLEHATIPPYLTALYSIIPGTNSDAFHILRVAAVEEMLHLTLVANVLNAVGGSPDLTSRGFVPEYPAYLPDGETDFQVSRQRFSKEAIETFLCIERPRRAPGEEARLINRGPSRANRLAVSPDQPEMQFYSIGEFYSEIERGLRHLHAEMGDALFCGDPARQAKPDYFYSGGGEIIEVTDLVSANSALRLIAEQGEGFGGGIFDMRHELAHYYRFQQLILGRFYIKGDQPDHPTGPLVNVDWDASYPMPKDVTIADYPEGSELRRAAIEFNVSYGDFLALLTSAYNGQPELLIDAVVRMFQLRDAIFRLLRNPIPGRDGENGAPTFEVTGVAAAGAAAASGSAAVTR